MNVWLCVRSFDDDMVVFRLVLLVGCNGRMYRCYNTVVLLLTVVIFVVMCIHLDGVDMLWL